MIKRFGLILIRKLGYELRKIPREEYTPYSGQEENHLLDGEELISIVSPYTMVSRDALVALFQQVKWCERKELPGDFVECGVWKGGAIGLMALGNLSISDKRRHIHCFDVFDDICEPDPLVDGEWAVIQSSQLSGRDPTSFTGELVPIKGFYETRGGPGFLFNVRILLEENIGYPREFLHYYEGWFQDTLPKYHDKIDKISILRLDGDWYASTKVCLEWLYDKVVPGGFVIVDDYGTYEGCRKAVDEFLISRKEDPFLHYINKDCRYWQK
jgi:O-methyltransferase